MIRAGNVCAAVAAAAFAEVIIDAVLGATTGALRGIASFRATLQLVKPVLLGTVLYTPVVVLLIYACQEISEWSVIVFVAPAFAAHRFHSLYREERDARQALDEVNSRLQRANLLLCVCACGNLGCPRSLHRGPLGGRCCVRGTSLPGWTFRKKISA